MSQEHNIFIPLGGPTTLAEYEVAIEAYQWITQYAAENKLTPGQVIDSLVRQRVSDHEAMDIIRRAAELIKKSE